MIRHLSDCWDRALCDWGAPRRSEPLPAPEQARDELIDDAGRAAELDIRIRFAELLTSTQASGRAWGLFRPDARVLEIKAAAWPEGQYKPGDRLAWRPAFASENAWVDAETGQPLNGSLTWPQNAEGPTAQAFPTPAPNRRTAPRRPWWWFR